MEEKTGLHIERWMDEKDPEFAQAEEALTS